MKISVVMSYYNRLPQLIVTLKSMMNSLHKDFEVIMVDDGSSPEHDVSHIPYKFPFVQILTLKKHGNNGSCPSALLNMAISRSKGDIILMQNPENAHLGDILSHADKSIKKGDYILYDCRYLDDRISYKIQSETNRVHPNKTQTVLRKCLECDSGNYDMLLRFEQRLKSLNWCSAISREDMQELNGFDERYSKGCWMDDLEFWIRINKKGMNVYYVPPFDQDGTVHCALHQYHDLHYEISNTDFGDRKKNNENLFYNVTIQEPTYVVNPGKSILS